MSSYEQRFYRENPTALERVSRNVRLLCYLASGLLAWFTTGRRVRRAYDLAQQNDDTIKLEDFIPAEDE